MDQDDDRQRADARLVRRLNDHRANVAEAMFGAQNPDQSSGTHLKRTPPWRVDVAAAIRLRDEHVPEGRIARAVTQLPTTQQQEDPSAYGARVARTAHHVGQLHQMVESDPELKTQAARTKGAQLLVGQGADEQGATDALLWAYGPGARKRVAAAVTQAIEEVTTAEKEAKGRLQQLVGRVREAVGLHAPKPVARELDGLRGERPGSSEEQDLQAAQQVMERGVSAVLVGEALAELPDVQQRQADPSAYGQQVVELVHDTKVAGEFLHEIEVSAQAIGARGHELFEGEEHERAAERLIRETGATPQQATAALERADSFQPGQALARAARTAEETVRRDDVVEDVRPRRSPAQMIENLATLKANRGGPSADMDDVAGR